MNLLITYAVHRDLDRIAAAVQHDPEARDAFTRLVRNVAAESGDELAAIDSWVDVNDAWLDNHDA